jgi:hypothetical protein
MTTTIIVGGVQPNKKIIKTIEFKKYITGSTIDDTVTSPREYKFIELIAPKYFSDYDVMFAYNNPDLRSYGSMYLGFWNDGVVAERA